MIPKSYKGKDLLGRNGEERKKRLEAAGYDYRAVQDKVNGLLK